MDSQRSSMIASMLPKTHELFDAVASQSIQGIVRLYASEHCIQADCRDHEGNTALHMACRGGNVHVVRTVLILFEHKYGLSKKKNKLGLRPIDITHNVEIRKSLEIFDTNNNIRITDKPHSLKQEMQRGVNNQLINNVLQEQESEKPTVLLALDGGGIRGIVLLQLLMNLERRVGESIYRHVDWVAGTSTGAIVALGIGLNKTLEDNLKVYLRLKNEIFSNSRPYNCNRYETYLKFVYGARTKMAEMKDHKVIITACQSNIAPPKLKLYRNYQPTLESRDLREYEYEDPENVYIWKAARASSAAPTYFLPFEGIWSDGGIMANNPTEVLLTEFYRYKQIQEYVGKESPPPLSCVISLGTGMVTPVTISSKGRANDILKFISRTTEQIKNMAMVFIKQITASDGLPVDKARNWTYSNGVPYFRFSPPLTQKIDLDENRDTFIMQMMWDTEVYMANECAEELDDLAKFLQSLHSTDTASS